ncbi:putative endopeptidase Clp [Rosa chinensis]|uniref:Putative endopeptidase Clp n=1 Tax=Rosa chinensis TaxID=74649 RepID=A0A2P6SLS1_ROSCH|nr:putative endopeptidase Clp [Rosa chinensis]
MTATTLFLLPSQFERQTQIKEKREDDDIRSLSFNSHPAIVKSNGLNSTSASSIIDCSTTTRRKGVGLVKASSPTRPTLSSNWDFQFVATTTTSAPRVPRFEELDTTNMLLRQRIIFLGSQVDDMRQI